MAGWISAYNLDDIEQVRFDHGIAHMQATARQLDGSAEELPREQHQEEAALEVGFDWLLRHLLL